MIKDKYWGDRARVAEDGHRKSLGDQEYSAECHMARESMAAAVPACPLDSVRDMCQEFPKEAVLLYVEAFTAGRATAHLPCEPDEETPTLHEDPMEQWVADVYGERGEVGRFENLTHATSRRIEALKTLFGDEALKRMFDDLRDSSS